MSDGIFDSNVFDSGVFDAELGGQIIAISTSAVVAISIDTSAVSYEVPTS